ncbi:cytochrome P450 [Actinoallomurus rhizosphaericola]|uniref:cytochrome P450 n=1 Tax=Actinoallomurus rhizosphaericola TaxID=2952536 RepID=UPI0020939E77|nr:cytochrome P450 [Actinoallomurus rhizosphaericola]MCO5997294.1 cytochrome P450 [Actinoallomurus rhizosphaericola]
MTTRSGPAPSEIGLSSLEFWALPVEEREAAFAELRARERPAFFPEVPVPFVRPGKGFYALVRHADVSEASRHPDIFSSEPSATSIPDFPAYMERFFGSLINMDDPRHAKIRRVVSRAFTPKMLARTEEDVRRRAARIVDELIETGPGDFVAKVAVRLPAEVICAMLGIPEREYPRVVERTNVILGNTDPEYTGITPGRLGRAAAARALFKIIWAARDLHRLAAGLGRQRAQNPTGDLTSALVSANVDGERLTVRELGSFFLLLAVAGNETTRTALSHALKLFTDFPDQRALLLEDFEGRIGGAVEEIVRYSTPVIFMRRNLTRDHEMNGHTYRAGDKVLLYYNSANRDETVFERPDVFDITRDPNPHVGFGGPGPHFCLGANLARREITVMLRELFTRLPDIRAAGEPDRLLSGFINGYKRLPCTFTAR